MFFSKICYTKVNRKELLCKIPFIILSLGGIIISGSRGVFLVCSLVCIYLVLKNLALRKTFKILILLSVLVFLLMSLLKTEKYETLSSRVFQVESYQAKDGGIQTRTDRYMLGLMHFLESPILGNGMSKMSPVYDYSHNIFISIIEDTGLLGLGWLVALVGFIFLGFDWKNSTSSEFGTQPVARNTIVFLLLISNLYGTIISQTALFLLLSMYYFNYRRRPTFSSL